MIDLHLHLDGSLSKEDFEFLARVQGVDLGSDFPNNTKVSKDCKSLEEYLERFDLPLKLLQDEFSIAYAVKSLVNRLYNLGYIYAEIRFAPQLHTKKGMSQEHAVISALTGLNSALKDKPDFDANLILCSMRQGSNKKNAETIRLAKIYQDKKVVAVDMAGPEAFHTGDFYKPLFDQAKKYGLNIICHAGEACGSDEVMRAINLLHAQRIGHGVHLDLNYENVRTILEKRIAFEFCPTSNLQTTSLESYEKVPLSDFLKYGICVTINSDNMTVSDTNVLKEYRALYSVFKFEYHELKHLLTNSINAAFVSLQEKEILKKRMNDKLEQFYYDITRK